MKNFHKFLGHKNILTAFLFLIVALLIFTSFVPGTETKKEKQITRSVQPRLEIPDDPYLPVPREGRATSPAYRFSSSNFFTTQVNVIGTNYNIIGDAANEPSIAVDPTDPNRMTIGWRQFNSITSNFREAGYAFTTDGGQTWTFPGVIEPGAFRSDPVLDSDSEGTFYYNSLTVIGPDYVCHVFKSTDGGNTWVIGTFAWGGDKQWMVVDKTGGVSDGNIYCYWTQNYSICYPGFFIRSANHGASYEECLTIPGSPFWGTLAVNSDGILYVGGATDTSFLVAKSSNALDSSQIVAWDFSTVVDLDGTIGLAGGPNPGGLLGQTWIAVDRSNGPNHGNVYLLCSVKRSSVPDSLDIMFSRSMDEGLTWDQPIRVNDDPSTDAWQWFGTMSVAPNGRIDVIWLDTRDYPGTFLSSLYYSNSLDGGATWSVNERLSGAFDPHIGWPQQNKMGDYFDMVSDDNGVHLAWAATFNGEQDVYYGRITLIPGAIDEKTDKSETPSNFSLLQNYPNPFNATTVISWRIPSPAQGSDGQLARLATGQAVSGQVKLTVYTLTGQKVATLVDEKQPAGTHSVEWDASDLASGVYFYRLQTESFSSIKKMIIIK
jgi:hypothetical protein